MASTSTGDVDIIQSRQNDVLLKVKLIIHHRCPGIELVFPVYTSSGICHPSPDQRVEAGSTMQTCFYIHPNRYEPNGILMYELRRKNTDQSNGEVTCIQLFVKWIIDNSKKFLVVSRLIENDKGYVWDQLELISLAICYDKSDMHHDSIEETWLMRNDTVLVTRVDVILEECYKLEITLAETNIEDDTLRPWYFDVDR
jgi:hypothetical protein